MNIIIAVNDNYIEQAKTMLFSLASNNTENIDVFLLYNSISNKNLDEFNQFIQNQCHGELVKVPISPKLLKNAPIGKWLSLETYFRVLAFEFLPKQIDRALWLDADIIVNDCISDFYHQSFEDKLAVVCAEKGMNNHKRLNLSSSHRYFNAGVILFNFKKIRERYSLSDVLDCIEQHQDHLDCMDQDVLNIMLMDSVKYQDSSIFNNGVFGFSFLSAEKKNELKKARIIHFWGAIKPWNYKDANWADKYWWKYELMRGGRVRAFLKYRLANTPIKIWFLIRECYYIVRSQLIKIKTVSNE